MTARQHMTPQLMAGAEVFRLGTWHRAALCFIAKSAVVKAESVVRLVFLWPSGRTCYGHALVIGIDHGAEMSWHDPVVGGGRTFRHAVLEAPWTRQGWVIQA